MSLCCNVFALQLQNQFFGLVSGISQIISVVNVIKHISIVGARIDNALESFYGS